jgi:hypothetical protein
VLRIAVQALDTPILPLQRASLFVSLLSSMALRWSYCGIILEDVVVVK